MIEIIAVIAMSVISVCLVVATVSLWVMRHGNRAVLMALNGLGETYKLGYEVLTVENEKLEARVKRLEERCEVSS